MVSTGSTAEAAVPFYVMKSNGGVLSADEVVHQPITTVLSGPAAGALGAALVAQVAGFDRVLTCDGGGTSTDVSVVIDGEPTLTTEGSVGAYPSKIPMIDVVTVGAGGGSIAWLSPEGALKVGPHSAGADPGPLCYAKGGTDVTVTDAHVVLGRIPPHLLGGEIPLDVDAARDGVAQLAGELGLDRRAVRDRGPRDLRVEPGERAAADHRQAGARRPRLHADDVRRLRLAAAVPADGRARAADRARPAGPGQRVGLRAAHRRRQERLRADARLPARAARPSMPLETVYDELGEQAAKALAKEGFAPDRAPLPPDRRPALLRAGVRGAGARPRRTRSTRQLVDGVASAFHAEHRALYGYDFADDSSQQVEWVNLRVSGVGPIKRPEIVAEEPEARQARPSPTATPRGQRARSASTPRTGTSTPRCTGGPTSRPGRPSTGPAILEEFGSTVPLHPGFVGRVDAFRNIVVTREGRG